MKLSYNGSSFVTAYYGTMSFDYTTGDLYWIALRADDNKQQLYTVNLETGNMEALGAFWGDFVGLYIPYTLPENENAPAKSSGFESYSRYDRINEKHIDMDESFIAVE